MIRSVSFVSLLLSAASFVLFSLEILNPETSKQAVDDIVNVEGWARLAEAIAKVIDSLNNAGPTVLTLAGAIVFMIIAYLAAKT